MWNLVTFKPSHQSPLAEVMSRCTSRKAIRLAVYNMVEGRIESAICAPQSLELPSKVHSQLREIANHAPSNMPRPKFAILAYDKNSDSVYLVELAPELNAAVSVLLCLLTELMGGQVEGVIGHQGNGRRMGGPCTRGEEVFNEDFYDDDDDDDDDDICPWDDEDYGRNPSPRKAPEVVRRDARGRFIPKTDKVEITPRVSRVNSGQRFHLGRHRR